MKRFNVEKELSKFERNRFISSNRKSIMSVIMPFFIIGFSCCALTFASYSLENDNSIKEETLEKENVIQEVKENIINDDWGKSEYFVNDDIKYVNLNNMIFIVLRINGNGTYRIMLDYNIERDYSISVEENIKNWFYTNFSDNQYVVKNTYDNNLFIDSQEVTDLMNLTSARFDYYGLLSPREFKLIYQYDDNSSFFLEGYDKYNNRWCNSNGMLKSCTEADDYGIRPVININVSKFSGEGNTANPYVIEE